MVPLEHIWSATCGDMTLRCDPLVMLGSDMAVVSVTDSGSGRSRALLSTFFYNRSPSDSKGRLRHMQCRQPLNQVRHPSGHPDCTPRRARAANLR